MVATDSYRLSVKETRLEPPPEGGFEANVPARALEELRARARRRRGIRDRRARQPGGLLGRRLALSSRLIDGQFPNYRQLLPEAFEHELTINREELAGGRAPISLWRRRTRRCGWRSARAS